MDLLDRYAYSNRLHNLHPLQKAMIAGMGMALCLILNHPLSNLFAGIWMISLTIFWAGLPGSFVIKLTTAEAIFILLTALGVAVSVHTDSGSAADWQIGGLFFSVSNQSFYVMLQFLTRALGCIISLNFLALTTPMVDIIEGARHMHVPSIIIELMSIIYRQIFILLETVERMITAQKCRLGYLSVQQTFHSLAALVANLFIEAYQHSQRTQIALESRGYTGEIHVLMNKYQTSKLAFLITCLLPITIVPLWWILR